MSEDRRMLSRWSQRKAAARRGETLAEPTERDEPQVVRSGPDAPPVTQDDGAADEMPALPPIEELTATSDYTAFLGKKVPEHLRRAALRKLWGSDPVFANLDGLNHYDEDYNLVDTTISAAQTAYRAGSGYLEEIEKTLDQVRDALGTPRPEQIESVDVSTAEEYGASAVTPSGTGDKSVDALQQVASPSGADDARQENDK